MKQYVILNFIYEATQYFETISLALNIIDKTIIIKQFC